MAQPEFRAAGTVYAGTAEATSHAVPYPTVQAGDLIVLLISWGGSDALSTTIQNAVSQGWTAFPSNPFDNGSTAMRMEAFYKFASGSESGSVTFTTNLAVSGQGRMHSYYQVDSTNPFEFPSVQTPSATTQNFIACPAITPSGTSGQIPRIIRIGLAHTGTAGTTVSVPEDHNFRGQAQTAGGLATRTNALMDKLGALSTEEAATQFNLSSSSAAQVGVSLVMRGAQDAGSAETLEPDSVVGTPLNLTPSSGTALAALQAAGGAYLAGTDPSDTTGLTNGPEYVDAPASATAWSGGTGASWGTYANVIDTSETTLSTVTLGSTNTDYQNFFSFAGADWSDLPSDAIITGIAVTIRHTIGTANRVQQHIALATANGSLLAGANELNVGTNTVSTTTLGATTNTEKTVDAFGAFPTRAQLITGTFGVRLRQRRSNTSTISIYSIEATVTYSTPGPTTPTNVRVALENPLDSLDTGNAVVTAALRRLGNGASNPTAAIRVRRAGSNTDLAEQTAISVPDTTFANKTLTFDQSALSGDADDFEVFVESAGVAGALVEVDYIKADVLTEAAPAGVELSGTLSSGGNYAGAVEVSRPLSGTISSGGNYAGAAQVSRPLSGTISSGGAYAGLPSVEKLLSGTLSSGGVYATNIVHTDVRLTLEPPPSDLVVGAGLQEFRIEARKVGADTPLLSAYLYEAGVRVGSALLTDQPITSTTGEVFSATWDAASLSDISGADVELRVVITGTTTGYGELVDVEWNATHEAAGEVLLSGTLSGGGAYVGALEVSKLLSGTISSGGNYAGALVVSKLLTGTISAGGNYVGAIEVSRRLSGALAGGGTYSGAAEVSRSLSGALGSGGQYAGTIEVSKLLSGAFSAGGVYEGALAGAVLLSGTISSGGMYVGVPQVSKLLSGSLSSGGLYQGELAGAVLLSGTISSGATYTGQLTVAKLLSGTITSGGLYVGTAQVEKLLSGTLSGGGVYVGVPLVTRALSGTVSSGGLYLGDLASVGVRLSGTLAGGTNYAGQVVVTRGLSGILASGGLYDGAPEIGLELVLIISGRVAPKIYAEGEVAPKIYGVWTVTPKLIVEGEVAEKVYAEPSLVP